ncbi:MAG: rhomboid family intramembrane serine protease [Fuerstiella sp.]|nr:rhomboid family intramembrane serine protease [Fuerstiella sp.]MCP4507551.1 rhomboid family intramembrane serine protease [Fuerstiella sp.]
MKHRIVEELHGVAIFVAIIWGVFVLDTILPGEFNDFGLSPRSSVGLTGIVTMPFLHGGWDHLIGNTVPLIVLLCLLAGSRANTFRIVPQIVVMGGVLLWVFGTGDSVHVGASGLIYGLIAFLIVAGFREGRLSALVIAVFVGFTYGATLIGGVLPTVGSGISWDGHLMGAIAGGLVARVAVTPDNVGIKR